MGAREEFDLILNIIARGQGAGDAVNQLNQIETAARRALNTTTQVQQAAASGKFVNDKGQTITPGDPERVHKLAQATAEVTTENKKAAAQAQATGTAWERTYAGMSEAERAAFDAGAEQRQKTIQENQLVGQSIEELNAKIRQSVKEEKAAARERVAALKPYTDAVQGAIKEQWEYRRLQYAGRALTDVSQTFFVPSVAILTGAALWASNYVKNAKTANEITIQWKAETDRLSDAQNRIGGTLAKVELPVLQQLARLAENAANFVESHPDIVKAGLNIAGAVALVSGIGLLVAKGIRLYADVGYMTATNALMAAETRLTAADIALTAAVEANTVAQGGSTAGRIAGGTVSAAGTAGAGITSNLIGIAGAASGVAVGVSIYDAIAQKYGLQKGMDILKEWATIGTMPIAGWWGAITGLYSGKGLVKGAESSMASTWNTMTSLLDIGGAKTTTTPTANRYSAFVTDNLQLFMDYQKQVSDAATNYSKQRLAIETNYEKQRTEVVTGAAQAQKDAEANYQAETAKAYADYQQTETEAERTYYANRLKAARDNSQKLLEMEQDHQIETTRDLEDHNDRQKALLESRDGLAMFREDEQYEKDRRRKEEDYALEVSRVSEQTAQTLRDNETQFAAERAQRARAFQQQLADNANNFKIEQARAKAQEEAKLKELEETRATELATLSDSYREQLDTLQKSFRDRLRAIDANILGDQYAVEQESARAHAAFLAWLVQARNYTNNILGTTKNSLGQASGGYAYPGIYYQRAEQGTEFVLSHNTTRAAEQAIGGQLTQERLIAALGNRFASYVDRRTLQFNGMTEADRTSIRRDIYDVTKEVLKDAMA